MGGFASIVRGALSGLNESAGNTQTAEALQQRNQQAQEAKRAQIRAQLTPHAIAVKGLQERLQALDPSDPHYADQKAILTNDIARNLHEVRSILYPDQNPQGNFFERGITDKLHLTSMKHRQDKLKAKQEKGQKEDTAAAAGIAEGQVPFKQSPEYQKLLEQRQTQLDVAEARQKDSWVNFRDPVTGREQSVNVGRGDAPPEGWVKVQGGSTVDDRKRADFAQFQKDHPDYKGSFEEWIRNPSGINKPGTPRVGTSNGKNVYALLTDKGWVDAGTREPLKDFRPLPTFAQQGLYGIDMMQNADGTIGSALLNRRTGQFKPITSSGQAPIAPQIFAQVNKSIEPAIESDTRFRVMKDNEKDALNGNQQAMLSLVANHMGMTLGQQKGTRINQAQWNEAIASAPWVEAQVAKWFHQDENGDYVFDGYKSGVTITGDQIHQMVDLAKQRRLRQWQQAQQAGQIYGVNVPVPDDLDNPSTTLEGPKTKNLKKTRETQKWTAPVDAPPAPKEDGKVLKADGKVIAISKGGQWSNPDAH